MKKTLSILGITAVAAIAFTAFRPLDITPIEIGAKIPKADVKMKDVMSGKDVSLTEAKKDKGLLVIFSCNTCPFVIANEVRIKEFSDKAVKMNIGVAIVNSNEARRTEDDSPDAMKKYGEKQGFTCAYVIDPKSAMADAFGATRTPECFLFDKNGVLVYHGAIDDNSKDATAATAHYLKDALEALDAGKEVKVKTSRSIGCSIKRAE
ncbi:MAG: alkyl hydroperoxide reductase [Bacteroidetes bacterium]|nr:MAG: alkyl hydroperoxide reductase [Bacteroidota bacterium]